MKGKVEFLEGPHEYLNEEGQKYLSVTQLISKFKEKFNAQEVAEKVTKNPNSKYYGLKVEDVIAGWDKTGQDARERGTAFHKMKEEEHYETSKREQVSGPQIKQTSQTSNPEAIIPKEEDNVETDYSWLPDNVYSELIVWSHKWKLAGIADRVIVDGDYFDIEDYKTNRRIEYTSFFKKGEGYRMMKFPLNNLMDCSFQHYELQLSTYAFLFAELSGKKPRNLTIIHHPTTNGVVNSQGVRHSCNYRRYEVMLMLNMWGGYAPSDYKPKID